MNKYYINDVKTDINIFDKKDIKRVSFSLISIYIFLLIFTNFFFSFTNVPTESMYPTIKPGYNLIVNHITYKINEPKKGDIVVFKPNDLNVNYVKRIIAAEGDHVEIKDGEVYVNNVLLLEPYKLQVSYDGNMTFDIPEDSYLMLGDNRDNSQDARYWENPYIHKSQIKGKAIYSYKLSKMNFLKLE